MSDKLKPYLSKDEDLEFVGLEPFAESERGEMALGLMHKMLDYRRSFSLYMDLCVHCGACIDQCHSYLGTGDMYNSPVGRGDLARQVYRQGFPLRTRRVKNKTVAQETLEKWYSYYYQCNECRRCAEVCPVGIDTAEITIAMREILAYMGMVPRFMTGIARNMYETGNNMGIKPIALQDMVEFLEEELEEETGKKIPIPLNDVGAEVLYNPSSSDFFTNTDSIMGAAKMFYAAGIRWTLSEDIIETANFGLFFNEAVMRAHNHRLVDTARKLQVKRIVAGECGHGWRTWRMFKETMEGQTRKPMTHVIEEAKWLINDHLIQVDKGANDYSVTYHDPCNLGRGGGIYEEPREVLRAVVTDFREMSPNRELSYCCGGGSGLLMDEIMDTRMKLGMKKAESVKATGAQILCAPCAICKAQLPAVMQHYGVEVEVKGLMDLVGFAIVL